MHLHPRRCAAMAAVVVPGEVLQHGVHQPSPAPRGAAESSSTRPWWCVQPAHGEPLSMLFRALAATQALAVTLGWWPAGHTASRGVKATLLSSPGLFFCGAPDISSASFPFFQLKPPNCSPGLALMVYREGCRDANGRHLPRTARCCLWWGHLGSCPRRAGSTQRGSGVPGRVSPHLIAPACCRCSPCSQYTACSKAWLQTATQGGWERRDTPSTHHQAPDPWGTHPYPGG